MLAYSSSHIHCHVIKDLAPNLLRKKQHATATASTWKACPKSSHHHKPGLAAAIEQFCLGTRPTDGTCNAGTAKRLTRPPNSACHPQFALHVSYRAMTALLKPKPLQIARPTNPHVHLQTWDVCLVSLNDCPVAVHSSLPNWTTTLSTTVADTYPAAFGTPLSIATARIDRSLAVSVLTPLLLKWPRSPALMANRSRNIQATSIIPSTPTPANKISSKHNHMPSGNPDSFGPKPFVCPTRQLTTKQTTETKASTTTPKQSLQH